MLKVEKYRQRYQQLAWGISIIVMGTGFLVLLGWLFDIDFLKSVLPNFPSMKVNTALCFIASGLALWLLCDERPPPYVYHLIQSCLMLMLLLAMLTLTQYIWGWQLGIDEWLFPDTDTPSANFPGRMSTATTINFILVGAALLLISRQKWQRFAQPLALAVSAVSLVGLIAYFYRVQSLSVFHIYNSLPLNTALCFFILGFGIVFVRPRYGIMHMLADDGPAGLLARRLLPAAILTPIIIGRLEQHGILSGLYDSTVGAVLFVLAMIIVLGAIIFWNTGSILQADRQRKMAEQQNYYQANIFQHVLDAVITTDLDFKVQSWNAAAEQIYGWKAEEILSRSLPEILSTDLEQDVWKESRRALNTQSTWQGEITQYHKDGILMYALSSMSYIKDQSGQRMGIVIVNRDITENKIIEEALHSTLDHLEQRVEARTEEIRRYAAEIMDLYDNAPCGYHALDTDNTIVRINNTLLAWLGYTAEEVVGKMNFLDLLPEKYHEMFQLSTVVLRDKGAVNDVEYEMIRKDGSTLPVAVSETVIYDSAGSPAMRRASVFDATLRRQYETQIRQLNQDLELRAHQLEASNRELESFSYSVSHDLRAPLRAVDGFSRILLEDYAADLPEEARRYLNLVSTNAQQMSELINALLDISRFTRQRLVTQSVALEKVVRQVIQELNNELDGRTVIFLVEPLPVVQADPTLIKQVAYNLLQNAVKFTKNRPDARIEIGSQTQNGQMVCFVKDNGVGFDMKYAHKLFGIFQRLHSVEDYEGTGIGLAIVQRIIQRHNGRIWVEAEPGKGTTFYFTLGVQS